MSNKNGGGGLSFWGMVGAVLVALLIFAVIGWNVKEKEPDVDINYNYIIPI